MSSPSAPHVDGTTTSHFMFNIDLIPEHIELEQQTTLTTKKTKSGEETIFSLEKIDGSRKVKVSIVGASDSDATRKVMDAREIQQAFSDFICSSNYTYRISVGADKEKESEAVHAKQLEEVTSKEAEHSQALKPSMKDSSSSKLKLAPEAKQKAATSADNEDLKPCAEIKVNPLSEPDIPQVVDWSKHVFIKNADTGTWQMEAEEELQLLQQTLEQVKSGYSIVVKVGIKKPEWKSDAAEVSSIQSKMRYLTITCSDNDDSKLLVTSYRTSERPSEKEKAIKKMQSSRIKSIEGYEQLGVLVSKIKAGKIVLFVIDFTDKPLVKNDKTGKWQFKGSEGVRAWRSKLEHLKCGCSMVVKTTRDIQGTSSPGATSVDNYEVKYITITSSNDETLRMLVTGYYDDERVSENA